MENKTKFANYRTVCRMQVHNNFLLPFSGKFSTSQKDDSMKNWKQSLIFNFHFELGKKWNLIQKFFVERFWAIRKSKQCNLLSKQNDFKSTLIFSIFCNYQLDKLSQLYCFGENIDKHSIIEKKLVEFYNIS